MTPAANAAILITSAMVHANTDALNHAKKHWLTDNPGILRKIADWSALSPTFVHDVFHHRRKSRRVEMELRLAGAPGFVVEKVSAGETEAPYAE